MSKSSLLSLKKTVQEKVTKYFSDGLSPQFIVAVSGGVDSMCLLHIFNELDISVHVAHVNYQKRGEASDRDAELVKQKAEDWGFKAHIIKAPPLTASNQNFQQWARNFRYVFFRDLAEEYDADGIALAHHRDDQVETVLQKLFGGGGLSSWSGMDIWDGELFRPLLGVSRNQIEQYAEENNIPYRTDESNLENDFARNFLRNEWTQKLTDFFPGWQSNILRMIEESNNYEAALQWIADRIVVGKSIHKSAFDDLADGLQRGLVLFLLKKRKPGIHLSQSNLHRVSELKNLQTGKRIELTSEFSIIRDRQNYVINCEQKESFRPRTIKKEELLDTTVSIRELDLVIESFDKPDLENGIFLDADKIGWPITLRCWQAGDRLQPLGMSGHQNVAEHLTNRKVSAADKTKVLVIESFEETICALIFPPIKKQSPQGTISELVKCDSDTNSCLRINYSA